MRLALFQPDQPGNVGAALRLGACLGVALDVIGPCGFPLSDRALKRAAMDYGARAEWTLHSGWDAFRLSVSGRLVLLTTRVAVAHTAATYYPGDTLLLGQESVGAPDHVHAAAAIAVRVPMMPGARSLNLVVAAAMVLGEALRQTGGYADT